MLVGQLLTCRAAPARADSGHPPGSSATLGEGRVGPAHVAGHQRARSGWTGCSCSRSVPKDRDLHDMAHSHVLIPWDFTFPCRLQDMHPREHFHDSELSDTTTLLLHQPFSCCGGHSRATHPAGQLLSRREQWDPTAHSHSSGMRTTTRTPVSPHQNTLGAMLVQEQPRAGHFREL